MGKSGGAAELSGAQRIGGTSFERGRALARRAREIIPGGAHTYAKGDDQYPLLAPPMITHGRGCRLWDMDGNQYIEYGWACVR